MVKMLVDTTTTSISIVYNWTKEFKSGRTNFEDNVRSRRPKTATFVVIAVFGVVVAVFVA